MVGMLSDFELHGTGGKKWSSTSLCRGAVVLLIVSSSNTV